MKHQLKTLALACGLALAGAAQAVLPLEGRTITGAKVDAYDPSAVFEYDPNQDLTWLRDWNVSGKQSWPDQLVWAGSLNVGAFANWSLPTSLNQDGSGPCPGWNCTGSQMGYMYYVVLGNLAGGPMSNKGPFLNVQPGVYWTSTEYAPTPQDDAWIFSTDDGRQTAYYKPSLLFAVAVRPGDVFAVPEPQTWAMLLGGLGVLAPAIRRRAP